MRLARVEESPRVPRGFSSASRRRVDRVRVRTGRPNGATAPSRLVARDGHFRFPASGAGAALPFPSFSPIARVPRRRGFRRPPIARGRCRRGGDERRADSPERHHRAQHVVGLYPNSSVSVFALHPLYLRVQPLVEEAAAAAGPEGSGRFAALRAEVDKAKFALDLKEVDYEATMKVKLSVARRCFDEVRATFLASEEFRAFLDDAGGWLAPYAVFSALRDVFGTAQHWRWGALSAENAAETVARLSQPGRDILHRRAALLPAVPPRRAAPRGGGARRGARGDSQGRPPHRRR